LTGRDPVDVPTVHEYVWRGAGEPVAETLGTIEVDDDGTVVDVVDVSDNVPGGRPAFIRMMQEAGWPIHLRR
jgi:hypothetical protein